MCHLEQLREVLQSEKDGNHIFRVKRKIGEISKGVGNRSGSQDHSKIEKIQKERYPIVNISMKDLSNIIKEFENKFKVPCVKSIPKSAELHFWLWRCGFHLFQTVKLLWVVQGDTLVTTLDLLVFPNFATTTIFHAHRLKQIFLTCELFLPEHLPNGATIINIRWCYNY